MAIEFEQNAFRQLAQGDEGSRVSLPFLRKAADKAAQKRLTANLGETSSAGWWKPAREEVMPAEKTIAGWFNEWLKQKTGTTKAATQARYKASMKAILSRNDVVGS